MAKTKEQEVLLGKFRRLGRSNIIAMIPFWKKYLPSLKVRIRRKSEQRRNQIRKNLKINS
jgi:hypothetical protein